MLCSLVLDIFKINIEEREQRARWACESFLPDEKQEEAQECRKQLVDTIHNYKQKFRGLQNLMKFTNKSILDRIEAAIV